MFRKKRKCAQNYQLIAFLLVSITDRFLLHDGKYKQSVAINDMRKTKTAPSLKISNLVSCNPLKATFDLCEVSPDFYRYTLTRLFS